MKYVTLELTLEEVNLVLAGLGELQAKFSLGLIDKVRGQSAAQLQQQAAESQESQPV